MKRTVQALALAFAVAGPAHADPMSYPEVAAAFRPATPSARIPYGAAPSQRVDLFLPEGRGPHPVVILLHGGCWNVTYGAETVGPAAADLAAHGVAVWSVEYRRIGEPGGGYPGMYEDVGRAVDLLRTEGPKRGLNPARVIAVGHSAGGHLALWAASRRRLPASSPFHAADPLRVRSVVSVAGVGDLKTNAVILPLACGDEARIDQVVGSAGAGRVDPYADTSPRAMLPTGVPTLQVTGVYDDIVPPYIGLWWRRTASRAGDPARELVLPDGGHVDVMSVASPMWPRVRAEILAASKANGAPARP